MKASEKKIILRLLPLLITVLAAVLLMAALSSCKKQPARRARIISAPAFSINGTSVSLSVPHSCETFSFLGEIKVSKNATWQISTDMEGVNTIPSKTVSLDVGDNIFYLLVVSDTGRDASLYTVTIRRRPMYRVLFSSGEGTAVSSVNVEEDSRVSPPSNNPSRTGYTFAGWDFDFSRPVRGNMTIFALWSPNTNTPYTVEYYLQKTTGNSYDLMERVSMTGTTAATVTAEQKTYPHFTYTESGSKKTGTVAPDGSLVLKLYYARDTYTVTFVGNGGTIISGFDQQTVRYGNTASIPTFLRTGYTFVGWDGIEECSAVSRDLTITAQWSIKNYTIEYDLDGGTNAPTNPATYTVEDSISLSTPTKEGYTFTGWSNGGRITRGSTENRTFTASWTPIVYSITYNLNGGTNASSNPTKYTIKSDFSLADPTRLGYTFAGWSNGGRVALGSTGNKTFTASWTPIAYPITYELNGGTNASANPVTYTIEDSFTLAAPTKDGYTFAGWSRNGIITRGTIGYLTFKADWTPIVYTITYNLDGGTNALSNPNTYTAEDMITLSTPTKTGFTFTGWSDGGQIDLGSTGDKVFTASWTLTSYPIIYVLNGGTNASNNPETYTIEDAVTLGSPTRAGCTFSGWSNGGEIIRGSTGIKNFEAIWTPIVYPITYVLNGGTNANNTPSTYTVEDAIILAAPTRKGYTFAGWSNNGQIVLGSTGAKTFTAEWTIDTYTITYELNGGTNATSNPVTYTTIDNIALASPTRDGFTFAGWYVSGNQKITNLQGYAGDLTLTASWGYVRINAEGTLDRNGEYILFGEYPQTIKADDVTITNTKDSRGYYLGSDGEFYAMVIATPSRSGYVFSTGETVTEGNVYYFKVEPIRWRILSESGGVAFILCDSIIDNRTFHNNTNSLMINNQQIHPNNYKESDIHAWLNEQFYETAFTELQRSIITVTTVDNSERSTNPNNNATEFNLGRNSYACFDTQDYVFLLSEREVTTVAFGFNADYSAIDAFREKQTSDYSRATGSDMSTFSESYGNGFWWLRSSSYLDRTKSRIVGSNGTTDSTSLITNAEIGVVPALKIRL